MKFRCYVISGLVTPLVLFSCTKKEPPLTGQRNEVIISELALEVSKDAGDLQLTKSVGDPFIGTVDFSNTPKKIWEHKLYNLSINGNTLAAPPIINEKCVYVFDAGGVVHCLDIDTGKSIWSAYTTVVGETGQSGGALAYTADNKLLVSTAFSECFIFDAKTGKMLSRMKLPAPCKGDGIAVENGIAYFNCVTNTLCAVDIASGKKIWQYNGLDREDGYLGMGKPVIYNDTIIVPSSSGELYCIQKSTGKEIWKTILSNYCVQNTASAISHLRAVPIIKDGVVYVVSASGMISAIMAATGDAKWSRNIGRMTPVNIVGNHLFVISESSEIARININTGAIASIFKVPFAAPKQTLLDKCLFREAIADTHCSQFLTNDSLLYVSTNGDLMYVDYRTGQLVNKISTGRSISVSPALGNRTMVILSDDGYVMAYR